MLSLWFLSALLNSGHFAILGQLEAAFFVGLSAVRFWVAAHYNKPLIMWCFITLAAGIFGYTVQSLVHVLPFIAALVGTYGSFQHNVNTVRICMAIGAGSWILHNILVGSPVAALMEIAFLSSNLLGYLKHKRQAPESS